MDASFFCCNFSYELYDGQRTDRLITNSSSADVQYYTTGRTARVVYVNSGTQPGVFRLQFEAIIGCRKLSSPANGSVVYSEKGRGLGGIASFYCNPPTSRVGRSSLQCNADQEWDGDPPTCVDTGCFDYGYLLRRLISVTYDSGSYFYTYDCIDSNATIIGHQTVTCQNGAFVDQHPTCAYLGCEVTAPSNGTLDFISTSPDGYVFTYKCDAGFYLRGNSTRLCSYNNVWLSEAPVCNLYVPLYPFGVDHGDIVVMKGDDICPQAVDVPNGIPFHNNLHTKVFVCINGLVSFEEPFLTPFPLRNISRFGERFLLAPFFADIDNRESGSVSYRTYGGTGNTLSIDSETVSKIDKFIETQADLKSHFTSTFILLVTWTDIVPFEEVFDKTKTATFQLVLATDGFQSYALYIYGQGRMNWALTGEDDPHIWIGVWAGEGFQRSHLYSFLPEALQMDNHAQHNGIHGLLTHSLTPIPVENPSATCQKWYGENKLRKDEITKAEKILPQCPCNTDSLRLDPWASYELPDTSEDIVCVDLLYAQKYGDHGKSCCYNMTTGLWMQEQPYAGGFNQYHPEEFPKEHANYDVYSREYCCKLSSLCNLYYELHPVGECYKNTPFKLGVFWGDPHLRTLDGREYTFNGLGEYLLLQLTQEDSSIFQLQGRTERAIKADGNLSQATVFSAFAASDGQSNIQIEMNFNKTGLIVKANRKDVTSKFYKTKRKCLSEPGMTINNLNGTIKTLFKSTGISFNISVAVKMLSITVTVPIAFENKTRGLLGNFDRDPSNDFIAPNGTVLPKSANMSERDIFHFGQLWAVTTKSTVFNYLEGKGHSNFVNSSYVPKFLAEASASDVAEAYEVCGGKESVQCVFDYVFTNDDQTAQSTRTQQELAANTANTIEQQVPSLTRCNVTAVTVSVGQKASCLVHFSDDGNHEFVFLETWAGVVFNRSSYDIEMMFSDNKSVTIRAVVINKITKKTSPEIVVPILMCSGCNDHGVCTGKPRNGRTHSASFNFQECDCYMGYDGDDCERDKNGCRDKPCSHNRQCTDLPPDEERIRSVSYICGDCPQGYVTQGDKCKDIDECRSNNPCQHICINTDGSFKCSCRQGYRTIQNDETKCEDINECDELIHDCRHLCTNTIGGYECTCYPGFAMGSAGMCMQVETDMCSSIDCSRAAGCRHNEDNETKCFCNHGFVLTQDNSCQDIDECKEGVDPCPHECENTIGSFKCTCHKGYGRQNDHTCTECKAPYWGKECKYKCQCNGRGAHKCHPVRGCECNTGWRGVTCDEDVDECKDQANVCPDARQTCTNTPGSFKCECVAGYQEDGHNGCKDIDECKRIQHDCKHECINTIGSYSCLCKGGYKQINKTDCQDIDECTDQSAGCEFKCENYEEHFSCYCPFGFVLKEDRKTCIEDENPCARYSNLTCDHFCVIRNESALCECKVGYKLGADKSSCIDVDECADESNNGCRNGAVCKNLVGSYNCSCPTGTRLDNDGRTCIACDKQHYGENCGSVCECVQGTCNSSTGCECMTGWIGEHCDQDVDECADHNSDELHFCSEDHTRCLNTPGSYQCQCEAGYVRQNGACLDIDECDSSTLNTCDQVCKNVLGSYMCSCNAGFTPNGNTCTDINECKGINGCEQLCANTLGSYRCSCHEGFRLNLTDRNTCFATSRCSTEDEGKCNNGQCAMLGSNSSCVCNKGFHLEESSCVDIKECMEVPHRCDQICIEEIGSFKCSCQPGYMLKDDFLSCKECDQWSYGENCSQVCLCEQSNTAICNAASGHCDCLDGWNGTTCEEDVNECEVYDPCPEHSICNNTYGSYYCICRTGFLETEDGTCIDINECADNVCNGHICNNTEGNYTCSCKPGTVGIWDNCRECTDNTFGVNCSMTCDCNPTHTIKTSQSCDRVTGQCLCNQFWSGDRCEMDVNECLLDSGCDKSPHTGCLNLPGSFTCDCLRGYTKRDSTGECFKDETKPLPTDTNGKIQINVEVRLIVNISAQTDLGLSTTYKSIETKVLVALYAFFSATIPGIEIFIYDIKIGSLIVNTSLVYYDTEDNSQLIGQLLSTLSVNGTLLYDQENVKATLGEDFNSPCEVREAILIPCPEHFSCVVDNDLPICIKISEADSAMKNFGLIVGLVGAVICVPVIAVCIFMLRRRSNRKNLEKSHHKHTDARRNVKRYVLDPSHLTKSHRSWDESLIESRIWPRKEAKIGPMIRPMIGSHPMGPFLPRPYRFGQDLWSDDRQLRRGPVIYPPFARAKPIESNDNITEGNSSGVIWRRDILAQQHSQETKDSFRIPRPVIRLDRRKF